ncbi:MAG: flagellar hook-basal body complex protein [Rhodospirillales bacterium]|nr:MAG: flagellar hook-basal body complex protein [Rhodospirillales bacterium]
MSLFGAMTSGVSGLVAQSSAMGAISDNITNVNTVGYKNVKTDFQSLVTKQTSVTFYSAGGVQAKPKQLNDVQGLLQATTSQTDMGVSGSGYFVVNEASRPTINNQFLFTRAGSFFQDEEGFLRNTAGLYLQGWPTDPAGNVVLPQGSGAGLVNQNIISTDFLQSINLIRVGGTASETSRISMGANLPATDAIGDSHKVDIQFFDTLGVTNDVSFQFTKAGPNQWDLTVEPPRGTSVLTLYDDAGDVYKSIGQLQFTGRPNAASTFTINGADFTFVDAATDVAARQIDRRDGRTLAQIVGDLTTVVNDAFPGVAAPKLGNATTLLLTGGGADLAVTGLANLTTGAPAVPGTVQTAAFTVERRTATAPAITFNAQGVPANFGVSAMAVLGFANGASDIDEVDLTGDGNIDVNRMVLDFGNVGEGNGMTQFGAEFTPTFIQQNGARFGVFAGVTIGEDGLMTALFDNGEIRPIFKIPVATFVNPNGLESRTGNVWNATQASGDPTLRVADNGPAGQVVQAALEASTVDIGEEFTNMIMVQRAYSAATRIISTADDMLEELVRIKR